MQAPLADIEAMVAGAICRDPDASEALVALLFPTIAAEARRLCPSAGEREDLVQDVFVRLFERLDQFRGGGVAIYAWARRIAITVCLNRRRWLDSRPELRGADLSEAQLGLIERLAQSTSVPGPEQAAVARDLVDRLLAGLAPKERLTMELLYLEECDTADVAQLTGWTAVRVRVTAFRARRKLHEVLNRLGEHHA